MNRYRFIIRSLRHYGWSNLTLFLGTVISIAVLTGALITGDSVQFSLERLVRVRLGKVTQSMKTPVYFQDDLAMKMASSGKFLTTALISSEGMAISNIHQTRINRVMIYGIDGSFGNFWDNTVIPAGDQAVISRNTAERLNIGKGDDILLRIIRPSKGPANAPFTAERTPSVPLTLTVAAIADDENMGKFSLKTSQVASFNIFISKERLERILKLQNSSNLLLTSGHDDPSSLLKEKWSPPDAGWKILKKDDLYEFSSEQLFIPENAGIEILKNVNEGTAYLSWLVNEISAGEKSTPYSFVTATSGLDLKQGEMIISSWLAEDLNLKEGSRVSMKYFTMKQGRELREESASFSVKKIIPLSDPVWDPTLMPAFPGISDALSCRDWESGTPIDLKKIRKKDEDYWKDHKGTPKAFISLEDGQKIWKNPYGDLTAVRFPVSSNDTSVLFSKISKDIDPASAGLVFDPVYKTGANAAAHSTDFGGLFLGLGFFIILAGLLLSGMLYSMQLSGRIEQFRIMASMGFTEKEIFRILYTEAGIVLLLAGITGAFTGIIYTKFILKGLSTIWIPATGTSDLILHIRFLPVLAGALSGIVISFLILFFILRRRIFFRKNSEVKTGKLGKDSEFPDLQMLIVRQLKDHVWRNAGIAVLITIGTYVILVTGINRRGQEGTLPESGTGGFLLYAETTVPLPATLLSHPEDFGADPSSDTIFNETMLVPLARVELNDASCLNLNRVADPVLTGVPQHVFDNRFTFIQKPDGHGPWQSLHHEIVPGLIPGFVDETVLKWGMDKALGDTILYKDDQGKNLGVIISGTIANSIFQGSILVSDTLLRKYFPSSSKNTLLLIDGDQSKTERLREIMENNFSDFGMTVIPASERLAAFDAVQNTYLSVFLLLGGFGILIASAGLGIFFIREMNSRRKELAILSATGFSQKRIVIVSILPYIVLLMTGIVMGLLLTVITCLVFSLRPDISLLSVTLVFAVFLNGIVWIFLTARRFAGGDLLKSLQME